MRTYLLRAVALLLLGSSMFGCAFNVNGKSLSGMALNAAALYGIGWVNRASYKNEGYFKFMQRSDIAAVDGHFRAVLDSVNRQETYPSYMFVDSTSSPLVDSSRANSGRKHDGHAARQAAPYPVYDIDPRFTAVSPDSITYVVTYRGDRQALFHARRSPDRPDGVEIFILPFRPNTAMMSVYADRAQRQAVEALHEAFYMRTVGQGIEDITPLR